MKVVRGVGLWVDKWQTSHPKLDGGKREKDEQRESGKGIHVRQKRHPEDLRGLKH